MPSNAHAALATRLKDIDQLMAAHTATGGDRRGRRFELVALNRAAVLLLSAHLEGYLEDLFGEAMQEVAPGIDVRPVIATFSNPSIRELVTERNYQRYVRGFAGKFDDLVRGHVIFLTGKEPWPL